MNQEPSVDREVVLEIGAEGGSLSVERRRAPNGAWRFQAMKNEVALIEILGEGANGLPGIAGVGPPAWSFAAALHALDRYPWPKLSLIRVHRDVAAEVLEAVRAHRVSGPEEIAEWQRRLMRLVGRTTPRLALSDRFEKALRIAAIVHAEQSRKGTRIPYITHPVQVSWLLQHHGYDEAVVLAGVLHDVLEDASDDVPTRTRLGAVFPACREIPDGPDALREALVHLIEVEAGPRTRALVEAVTEVKTAGGQKRPWTTRKLEQLRHLRSAGHEVAALKAADALHNVQAILADVGEVGASVFARFKASVDDTLWYYGTVAALAAEALPGTGRELSNELARAAQRLAAAADGAASLRDPFTGRRSGEPERPDAATLVVAHRDREQRIFGLQQWRRLARPARGDAHWKDGRSAKELARAWFADVEAAVPADLMCLLESHDATRGVRFVTAWPECETRLDDLGKGRQHDLLLCGTAGGRPVLIAVEAKADETFGARIETCLRLAQRDSEQATQADQPASRLPERIDRLSRLVFGRPVDKALGRLRYQLLHGIAGTALEAHRLGVTWAAFIVHEFTGSQTDAKRLEANQGDLDRFVTALSGGAPTTLEPGTLIGPFFVQSAGSDLNQLPIYVGKVRTSLES
jgi:hypothetical protein